MPGLPNPGMSFTPFDPLPASELNDMVENIESLADGSGFDDASILPKYLVAGTGSTWAWANYTPVWTNLTVSGSTVVAKYIQIGKTVHFRISVVLGGGNAPTGSVTVSLPVTAAANAGTNTVQPIGTTVYNDSSATVYTGYLGYASTTTAILLVGVANTAYLTSGAISGSAPFTFGNGDEILLMGTYEAA